MFETPADDVRRLQADAQLLSALQTLLTDCADLHHARLRVNAEAADREARISDWHNQVITAPMLVAATTRALRAERDLIAIVQSVLRSSRTIHEARERVAALCTAKQSEITAAQSRAVALQADEE